MRVHHPRHAAAAALATALLGSTYMAQVSAQLPPGDGPHPFAGTVVDPTPVAFDDTLLARLKLPQGFRISVFARQLQNVRWLQAMPNGDLYVSRRLQGDVILLRDANRDGVADGPPVVVVQNMPGAHGLTVRGNQLYILALRKLFVADIKPDGMLGTPRVLLDDLPDAGQHNSRTLAFGPDGLLYVGIGSTCNNCPESNPENATMLALQPDGSARTVYAKGLRHTIGFGWHPITGQMWGFDHGSDDRGDDDPPEELNLLQRGKHYGWPWCYGDRRPDMHQSQDPPNTSKADFCITSEPPALGYTAHAAPIGMVFYTGSQFPAGYRNDAFVAMRGSWNRGTPSGYQVVRVRFDANGRPQGIEDFVSGWLIPPPPPYTRPGPGAPPAEQQEAQRPARFARVAGLAVAADGALLIADDENGVIYRVVYESR